ncbi:MAG: bile acid:sodium symporter family protein [Flammeovirgaceae bacterium]|nr:bile acid:sodium symporter family protein [Flammeovirgaceae bacterium]
MGSRYLQNPITSINFVIKKGVGHRIVSQYVLLPALTIALIVIWSPPQGIALGMILVAACPGGNVSNFFSLIARGNVALSVTLTAITSVSAFLITPLSFLFWSSILPGLRDNFSVIEINFVELFFTLSAILFLPLVLGMVCAHYYPAFSEKISKPIRIISSMILVSFVLIAFWNNIGVFIERISSVFWIVLIHNGLGLFGGYYFSKLLRNTESVSRSVAIETSIQNSGLGLILIFTFFGGNGDMALVAAWWAIWHLISGFTFAYSIQRKPVTL